MTIKESNIIKDSCYSQEQGSKLATSTQNEPISSNKRIAKNAIMLYIRMFISMIVGLYTSRVVLNTLGVEDYGIYGVVGGIVGMMGFLNASMSGATSRFITFELGKGDIQRLKDTFSSAMIVHIGIAIVVLVLAETIGLWFLNNKLVIPEGRMNAANWVYQMSVLSTIISVTQVPYNACIIAHEKMSVYAYIEIINVSLKLLIVYLLTLGDFDKLILYSILSLFVSILIMMIYRIYCIQKFIESAKIASFNNDISKKLISFSTYNLLGNAGFIINEYGSNFLINLFYGVVINASVGIATTVANIVNYFASNLLTVFRPQITKAYSCNNISLYLDKLYLSLKVILIIYAIVAIPVAFFSEYLLIIWLGNVPIYTPQLLIFVLICIFFQSYRYIIIMGLHATGKIKNVSLFAGILFLLNPILIYILFKYDMQPSWIYITATIINIVLSAVNIIILKRQVESVQLKTIFSLSAKIFITILISILVLVLIKPLFSDSIISIISFSLISTFITSTSSTLLLFRKEAMLYFNKFKIKWKIF